MAYRALAPRTPRQISRQATRAVYRGFNPLFAQINRRESGNQAAIGDYTTRLTQLLAPLANQVGGYYQQAETQQQGVNNQLADRLNSVGGQEASALQAKLAQAGLPTDQAQRTGAIGTGAANTGAALGSANLSSLLAAGTAQQTYAGKLPGIAALGGLQFAKQNLAQMEQQRSDLQAKVPGAIQSELSQLQNLEFQKAAANLGFAGTQARIGAQVAGQNQRAALTARGQNITARGQNLSHQDRVARIKQQAQQKVQAQNVKRKNAFYSTRQKVFTSAKSLYGSGAGAGASDSGNAFLPTPGGSKKTSVPAQQAYTKLWSQYGTQLVSQYGFKRPAVDTMIRRALKAAGYNLPTKAEKQAAAAGAAAASQAVGSIGL